MPTQIASATSQSSPVRVLIVDDMPQVRRELRQLLELLGQLEVAGEAASGREAIFQAEALHPDVVVMDLEMPEMGGCEATRQIKDRRLAKKVVILSVHAAPDEIERARQAGADDFVQKGASIDTLLNAIVTPVISDQAEGQS